MAHINYLGRIFVFLTVFNSVSSRVFDEPILDVLASNGFKIFASWCRETLPGLYNGSGKLTVFAFNDTSYTTLTSTERARLMNLTLYEKMEYVQTYTLPKMIGVDQLRDSSTQQSFNGKDLFINKRNRVYWDPGSTLTFINGAMIIGETLQASNGMIHMLDRPLGLISDSNVYQWLMNPDDPTVQTTIWRDLAARLYEDSRFFLDVVTPIAQNDKVTFFLPSENALRKIPGSKMQSLHGQELANYFKMHYIKTHVVYTSYVGRNESYETAYMGSRLVFMKQANGRVLVKSGGVTAMIERGNITVRNGVIHIIDRMFGFVYNSAREQIAQDAPTFNRLIDRVSPDLQALITQPSGVNMFIPTEESFTYINNLRGANFETNTSLVDYVVRLCMIKDGSIEVSQINGNYDVRQRRYSRYKDWKIVVYKDRNDYWVNAGNVRAKIVRPDIKVTTGVLQYIDAVPGEPSYDIPSLIYYDDYLIKTYNDLKATGLVDYLKDQSFDSSYLPPRIFDQYGNGVNNFGQQNNYDMFTTMYPNQYPTSYPGQSTMRPNNLPEAEYQRRLQQQQVVNNQYGTNQYGNNQYGKKENNQEGSSPNGTCGSAIRPCQFTVFVPNGTAIYNYYRTSLGNTITKDLPRYRRVLERLVIPNLLIFLEQMVVSPQSKRYQALNGDEILLTKETMDLVRLSWGGMSARVIMSDLGATNGVVHIIDNVFSSSNDTAAGINSNHVFPENQNIIG